MSPGLSGSVQQGGVCFAVRQVMQGLLAHDERDQPVAYMICEPASRYCEVMTRSRRMPVLIGERI